MKHIQIFEEHISGSPTEMDAVSASYDAAKVLASELSPSELQELADFYNSEGKESVAELIQTMETEMPMEESMLSQKEIRVRSILDKIIKGGGVAAMLGIVPAAMAGAPFLALGLGIAALAGNTIKDAAWWKKEGHYYKDQDKYGVK